MSPPKPSSSHTFSGDELGQSLSNLRTSFHSFVEKLDTTSSEVDDLLTDINYQVGLLTLKSTPSQSKDVTGMVGDHHTITKTNSEKTKRLKEGNKKSPIDTKNTGKNCFLCNAASTLKCEICFQTNALSEVDIPYYCGEDHQNLHLTLGHNSSCGKDALKLGWKEIRDTEGTNNGLPFYIATRELEAGEEIFTKKPLFTFPKIIGDNDLFTLCKKFRELCLYTNTNSIDVETCIICHEMMVYGQLMEDPIYGIRLNKCPSCGWPVHSSRDVNLQKVQKTFCQELKGNRIYLFYDPIVQEHEKECKIFTDNDITWDKMDQMEKFVRLSLGVLRVVINPVLKEKLLNLPASTARNFRGIHKFIIQDCKQSQVSEKELDKIIHVILSNFLPSNASYFSMWKKYNYTIYEGGHTGRILPHACNPNCSLHVNPNTGEATFKVRRKVEKNEMLTISYMVDSFPRPINQRAIFLIKKSFSLTTGRCKCARCKDGEDLTSAVKRVKGKKSAKHEKDCTSSKYLVPFSTFSQENTANKTQSKSLRSEQGTSSILKSNETQRNASKSNEVAPDTSNLYIWQCSSCRSLGPRVEQSVVHEKVEEIRKELKKKFSPELKYHYDQVKEIINKYSDKELHPSHCLMILAQVILGHCIVFKIRTVGMSTAEHNRSDLHAYFPDLDEAIQMLNRNDNGRSEMYGTLLYCRTLLEMSLLGETLSNRKKKPTFSEMQTLLQPIMNDLKESWEIMKDNPYLSAVESNRDIQLFELYAKNLEIHARALVDSPKESIFETFRTEQIKCIQSKSVLPSGSWYLYEVKSEGNQHSLLKKTATNVSRSHEGQIEKIEFKEQMNTISGVFIRELFHFAHEHF